MHRHLTLELYRLVLAGHLPAAVLAERGHRHLVECCDGCGLEWSVDQEEGAEDEGREGRDAAEPPLPRLVPLDPLETPPGEDAHVGFHDLEERLERQKQRTRQRRRVERQLPVLLAAAPEERAALVAGSRGRFRSRALAELLVRHGQGLAKDDPAEAESLLTLVPAVLDQTPGAAGTGWAEVLRRRALAGLGLAAWARGDRERAEALLQRSTEPSPPPSPDLDPDLDLEAEVAELAARLGAPSAADGSG